MKSIFASALLVAVTTAIKPVSAPEYLAGFIYGMSGANHLDKINTCFDGGKDSVGDIKKTIKDLKEMSKIKLALDAQKLRADFKKDKASCMEMDSDLALIEVWAEQFKHPESLAKEAGKNYLLRRATIKDDLAKEQEHWAAGEFFQAGEYSAMALTELIPIQRL